MAQRRSTGERAMPAPAQTTVPDAPPSARRTMVAWLDAAGTAGALVFVAWSLTPSLLPRDPAFQGLISGMVAAAGYGVGVLAGVLARRIPWRPSPAVRLRVRTLLPFGGVLLLAVSVAAGARWQARLHRLIDVPEPGPLSPLLVVAVAGCVFVVLLLVARVLRHAAGVLSQMLARLLPHTVAVLLALALVGVAMLALFDRVVLHAAFVAADQTFSLANRGTEEGALPPRSTLRSGGPGTLSPWSELGLQGRSFVAGGPTVAELSRFAGRPAREPIRVYVGLLTAEDRAQRVATAVAELERTGAFDREVLCVVTTTGTGWVNEVAASGLEYVHAGDTAIVATQYSYLPSWISFLADRNRAADEGRALFNAVYDRWSRLAPEQRPRLVVYGESLGANGSQAAFAGLGEVRARTDGALWVGPPNFNELWAAIVARRDPGTPERLPIYDYGLTVRFAADVEDFDRPDGPWLEPRVLFLQHASDPVVWWSPDLLFTRPDWLEEPRGDDVLPAMTWFPFVTFWQVTADLTVANAVPVGHGHRYDDLIPPAWAAVVPPEDWSAQDTERLQAVLRE